ncbi:MAG: acyl-CoA dehydrogenase family protein [Bacillota bacterium]
MQKGGMFLLESLSTADLFTPEDFTDEHRMIADTVKDFAVNEVAPHMEDLEHQKEGLMRSMLEKAGELGLLGADISEEYEGAELGITASALISQNVVAGGSYAVCHTAHTGIGTLPIVMFGNEEQKKKYLPGLATGSLAAAYALTEPMAGSDALAARTKAVLSDDGKYYILNGEKMFITNAGFADVFVTYAKIDGEKFTAFIIDKDTPGFSLGAEEKKLGIKGSSTRSLIFEDAQVPVENVLGEIGKGHIIAFNILNIGRFKLGAACVGSSQLAMEFTTKYALERQQFKTPLAKFGMIQHKVAEMNVRTYAAESAVYRLAGVLEEALHGVEDKDIGAAIEEYAIECSITKILGSEVLDYTVDEMVQIYGGYGYISEYPAERFFRDSRINRIFEGTNEINRLIIPGTILRRAMKGQIPLLQAAQALAQEVLNLRAAVPADDDSPLAAEKVMVEMAKKMFLMVGGSAAQKYMQKLINEQEIIAILADMVVEIYTMESCLLRALKALEANAEDAANKVELTKVYIYGTFPKMEVWGKEALAHMFEGDMLRTNLSVLKRMGKFAPIDLIALRRNIANRAFNATGYVV